MNYTNTSVYSLTGLYGFEYGKSYLVDTDNEKEIVMQNGQRLFKEHFEIHFTSEYTKLYAETKGRIERATKENHKHYTEIIGFEERIKAKKEAISINKAYIDMLEKCL